MKKPKNNRPAAKPQSPRSAKSQGPRKLEATLDELAKLGARELDDHESVLVLGAEQYHSHT